MNRRTLLKSGGTALLGLGLGGCRPAGPPRVSPVRPARPRLNLAPVHVSWDRVIRTTVGLRPHRDGGFVLRTDKLDDKVLVHNYGHGGAGMSLAWGCGTLVGDLVQPAGRRRVAVIGCGSPGLTTARQLQRRGYDVTIYAAAVPPDTTSNMSWAGYTPTSGLILPERRTPEWDAQFRSAAEVSYRQLQLMVGPRYGVYWIDSYNATDDPNPRPGGGGDSDLVPEHLRTGQDREVLGPGEHPFPTRYAIRQSNLAIEPSIYLDALVQDFQAFGGRIVIKRFESRRDLAALPEPVIVNCTGLGSFSLFEDEELVPVKGQLTFLVPQPEVNYRASAQLPDNSNASINPRRDGIVVGNSQERGVWSLEPNEEIRRRNVDNAIAFFSRMEPPAAGARLTRSEAPRVAPAVESFFDWGDTAVAPRRSIAS
ncbi:MAG: FAD-dependent oxidoreductase [Acidobacteria bacterium]|nr:FAD-dependent oxidoreductase [Acidobacteriota bacterium]